MRSKERAKMFSTVWTVFTWLFLFVAVFGERAELVVAVMLGLGLMTLLATFMIMRAGDKGLLDDDPLLGFKSKRGDMALIDRLLEVMDDAERAALRKRLIGTDIVIGDDGEIALADELRANHQGNLR